MWSVLGKQTTRAKILYFSKPRRVALLVSRHTWLCLCENSASCCIHYYSVLQGFPPHAIQLDSINEAKFEKQLVSKLTRSSPIVFRHEKPRAV